MGPLAKFASLVFALAATVTTAGDASAGGNWAREQVQQREAAVLARALGLGPTEQLRTLPPLSRIVGGVQAPAKKWPFQAGLLLASQSNNFLAQFCAGSVIDEEFILTAAHCAEVVTAGQLHILTGTQSLASGGTRHQVRRIRMHPAYNGDTFDYDIALVQLKTKITDIPPGAMAVMMTLQQEPVFAKEGTQSFVIGWGDTTGNETYPADLRQVVVPVVKYPTCNSAQSYNGAITTRMFCAGFRQGGKDSCQGDSGGPLLVKKGDKYRLQAGIVSWGEGCALPNLYGVYTRLAKLGTWANAHMAAMRASTASALACEISGNRASSPACRRAAKDEAEQEMKAYLDTIKRNGTPAQAQSATTAQRAWSQALDGVCAFDVALDGQLGREDCIAKEARKRANALGDQLSELSK